VTIIVNTETPITGNEENIKKALGMLGAIIETTSNSIIARLPINPGNSHHIGLAIQMAEIEAYYSKS
jgi:hypothetical protein